MRIDHHPMQVAVDITFLNITGNGTLRTCFSVPRIAAPQRLQGIRILTNYLSCSVLLAHAIREREVCMHVGWSVSVIFLRIAVVTAEDWYRDLMTTPPPNLIIQS